MINCLSLEGEYVVDLERAEISGWYILHTERRNVQHFPLSDHINMMRYCYMVCKQVKIKITAFVTQSSVKHG